jgi:hypothetical protein
LIGSRKKQTRPIAGPIVDWPWEVRPAIHAVNAGSGRVEDLRLTQYTFSRVKSTAGRKAATAR